MHCPAHCLYGSCPSFPCIDGTSMYSRLIVAEAVLPGGMGSTCCYHGRCRGPLHLHSKAEIWTVLSKACDVEVCSELLICSRTACLHMQPLRPACAALTQSRPSLSVLAGRGCLVRECNWRMVRGEEVVWRCVGQTRLQKGGCEWACDGNVEMWCRWWEHCRSGRRAEEKGLGEGRPRSSLRASSRLLKQREVVLLSRPTRSKTGPR